LEGGIDAWKKAGKEVDAIHSLNASEFENKFLNGELVVLDVRRESEYEAEHVKGAKNLPLDYINEWTSNLDRNKTYYIHCAGGYRSMIATSILKARGYEKLVEVAGGYKAIAETKIPITACVCPVNGPREKGWFSKVKGLFKF
jgi:rhodanese-related sulfurtransferase